MVASTTPTALRTRPGGQFASQLLDPLPNPGKAASPVAGPRSSRVAYHHTQPVAGVPDADLRRRPAGVPGDIGQRLLDDPVDRQIGRAG